MSDKAKSLLGFLVRLLRGRGLSIPRPAAVALCPPWTEADRAAWANFLQTVPGRKLKQRARSVEWSVAVQGAKDVFHTVHSAGKTDGFSQCVDWLLSLAVAREDEMPEPRNDDQPETEEEMIARLSP